MFLLLHLCGSHSCPQSSISVCLLPSAPGHVLHREALTTQTSPHGTLNHHFLVKASVFPCALVPWWLANLRGGVCTELEPTRQLQRQGLCPSAVGNSSLLATHGPGLGAQSTIPLLAFKKYSFCPRTTKKKNSSKPIPRGQQLL